MDAIVESIQMGACGWIAGLVNAFPKESVELARLAQTGGEGEGVCFVSEVFAVAAIGYGAEVCFS